MRHYLELFSGMQNLLRKKAHYLKSDCSKAHSLLGWQPQWSIGEPIEKAIAEIAKSTAPILVEVFMPYETECRSRLSFGLKLDEQSPKLDSKYTS